MDKPTAKDMLVTLSDKYEKHFGFPYNIQWSRETKAIKTLMGAQEPSHIVGIWEKFLHLSDDWYDGKKDISVFCSDFNRICQHVEASLPRVNLDDLRKAAGSAINKHKNKLREIHGQIIASKQSG